MGQLISYIYHPFQPNNVIALCPSHSKLPSKLRSFSSHSSSHCHPLPLLCHSSWFTIHSFHAQITPWVLQSPSSPHTCPHLSHLLNSLSLIFTANWLSMRYHQSIPRVMRLPPWRLLYFLLPGLPLPPPLFNSGTNPLPLIEEIPLGI